jgi:radical SAM superfamily enzyme YgiQ (UPF0313 family)
MGSLVGDPDARGPIRQRVLLIYANREREPWPVMPIGLSFVAAALKARGHEVSILDLVFCDDWPARIGASIDKHQPQIVGIGIRNIDNVDWSDHRNYLEDIRDGVVAPVRAATQVPIVVGGAAVNIMPHRVLEYLEADFVVHGDGEEASCELFEAYASGRSTHDIRGVIARGDAGGDAGVEPRRVERLAAVHRPRIYSWVDLKPYLRAGTPYPVQTKRGCALDCSFCVYGAIEGSRYRLHTPTAVADEIEGAHHRGVRSFEFTDSMFNIPIQHAIDVCREIAARDLAVRLNTTGVHPVFFTPELMEAMERAGFEEFSFAPDSASPAVLADLGKGFSTQHELIRAAELVRASRLKVMWWFSFGLPGETEETVNETLSFVRDHVRPTDLAFCTVGLRILPKTRLARIAIEEGRLDPDHDMIDAVFYEPEGISLEQILERLLVATTELPNLVLNSEARSFPLLIRIGSVIKRLTRHRKPLWAPIPMANRMRNLGRRALGAVSRGPLG